MNKLVITFITGVVVGIGTGQLIYTKEASVVTNRIRIRDEYLKQLVGVLRQGNVEVTFKDDMAYLNQK